MSRPETVDEILQIIRRDGYYPLNRSTTEHEKELLRIAYAHRLIIKEGHLFRLDREGIILLESGLTFGDLTVKNRSSNTHNKKLKLREGIWAVIISVLGMMIYGLIDYIFLKNIFK